MKQLDALFIFSLCSHNTSTCFRLAICPSSGGYNVYMQQLVHVIGFSGLSAGLVPNMYQLLHIQYTLLPPSDGQLASLKHAEV
jgi:hypothetical protein